ncbi:class I SAM-dependent methyltransferase [Marinigracilibium pacificum]|uniref:Class I SAM-dependent methyltransferase n=1 Tax=Marinigracilibium pacificum TaxID=2729599 RepID=A0A848J843_9BACT|nr:class I SAM-dependent methyltransferase [Marinigracilibium pacificum]NMM50594.1 class I SAM-dependent methyltransferase [Marinigracilibium pacificum]
MYFQVKHAFNHWLKCVNDHSLHSPFLFDLYQKLIRTNFIEPKQVVDYIERLKNNTSIIEVEDLGAGSSKLKSSERKVCDILRTSTSSKTIRKILSNYIISYNPQTIVELGTNLGVSTLSMSIAGSNTSVYTFEGSHNIASIAENEFKSSNSKNISVLKGNIDETLPQFLNTKNPQIDLAYIDANHTFEATIKYFNLLEPFMASKSAILIGDIYWSPGMKKAWFEIAKSNHYPIRLDFYHSGLLLRGPDYPETYEHLMSRPL